MLPDFQILENSQKIMRDKTAYSGVAGVIILQYTPSIDYIDENPTDLSISRMLLRIILFIHYLFNGLQSRWKAANVII